MPKLTAAQQRSIETVLYHLERAQKYIQDDATIIARKKDQCTTTLDFEVPGHGPASSICKDIGSDLAGLQMGIDYLKNFSKMNDKNYKPGM